MPNDMTAPAGLAFETVLVKIDAGIATITLNRPNKRNAMSPTLHREMTEALQALRHDDSVRCLVITGAGDFFCAGMDLKEYFIALKDTGRIRAGVEAGSRVARPHAAQLS